MPYLKMIIDSYLFHAHKYLRASFLGGFTDVTCVKALISDMEHFFQVSMIFLLQLCDVSLLISPESV